MNADGMTSRNYAIYNQRSVFVFDSPRFGRFVYIAIGALCVGSVRSFISIGTRINKGDKLGSFEFGGSTIAMVFAKGAVQFDADLTQASRARVESHVNATVGQQIETAQ